MQRQHDSAGNAAGRFVSIVRVALVVLLPLAATAAVSLSSVSLKPSTVVQGMPSLGTVVISGPAPSGGAVVSLTSSNPGVAGVPASITIPAGRASATFMVTTSSVTTSSLVTISATYNRVTISPTLTVTPRLPIRGTSGDLWADVIIGQPGFGDFTPNQVSANRVFNPGGVTVDLSVRPNRIYIYDGANSRVLGLTHLGSCRSGSNSGHACTANSDCPASSCAIQPARSADIVLGQPSFMTSACNGDSNFQSYPTRAPASASSLCGLMESQVSILEGGSFANMAVDSAGNLYVPDWDNHRVVRYNSPFATDTVADYVWGQSDFTGNACNRGRGVGSPDNESLCFRSPFNEGFVGGVGIDPVGNLWVTDNQNNRVLRFPKNPATGVPTTVADLVLGQPDFASSANGSGLNQMWAPAAVRVDGSGTVYVVDAQPGGGGGQGGRVLIFTPPLTSGMSASSTLGAGQFRNPSGIEFDPGGGIWVSDSSNNQLLLLVGGVVQKVLFKDVPDYTGSCGGNYHGDGPNFVYADGSVIDPSNVCGSFGGIGVDADGNVIESASSSWQDVWHFSAPFPNPTPGVAHSADADVFQGYSFDMMNQVGAAGLNSPNGVAVSGGQLIVADHGRILFWNNTASLTSGQPADGFTGAGVTNFQIGNQTGYGRLVADKGAHLWSIDALGPNGQIDVYTLPLTMSATPFATLTSPLPVLGGGTLGWDSLLIIGGIAPVGTGTKLWVADGARNRVFRISNPLTSPVVDIVLGQTSLSGTSCNQGNSGPSQSSLCNPGGIALDPQGNLYVSDAGLEVAGNFRMLEYDAGLFPANPANALFGLPATRVFGRNGSFTDPNCEDQLCGPLQPAFTSDGQMVVGMIGYVGSRFPLVYSNPLVSQTPDTYLNDFSSYGGYAAVFDSNDDLYIVDLDRARVLIYRRPLAIAGSPSAAASPASLPFPTQLVGTSSAARKVTLTNTGTENLVLSSIATSGDFSQTNTCGSTLAPGANCFANVVFKPTAIGMRTGTLTFTDNASGSPQAVALSGTGTVVRLMPTALNFGNQTVGTTSPPKSVTLTNTGSTPLNVTSITVTGTNASDFVQTNNCGTSVAAHASCTINVTFRPIAKGRRTAAVSISDDGGGSPQTVMLAGTGT